MRLIAGFTIIILAIAGCSGGNELPADVIAMKPMQRIVWDMIQADEAATQQSFGDSTLNLKQASFRMYDQVFAIHKVSREQFFKSYRYYQGRPDLYRRLMTGVKVVAETERKAALKANK